MGVSMMRIARFAVRPALLALVLAIAACRGESPTAPSSGGNGGGGTPPPSGSSLTVTVSNPTPVTGSTSNIVATATLNGAPVADGTAVEFTTTFGTFTDTLLVTTIRTTTNGVATATLSSASAGSAIVTVRVNNVAKTAGVAFSDLPPGPPPPPDKTPVITSISPTTGPPAGGTLVTITGKFFSEPVRVLIGTKEARVATVTSTQIRVITPPIDLGPSTQFSELPVVVIIGAGTTGEVRLTSPTVFRYQLDILTPVIFAISPSAGPNEGNTRIAISGEGFQSPAKVFFGTGGSAGADLTDEVEVQVIQVNFNQIIAVTPPALGIGASLLNQQVTVRVQNVASNKDAVLARGFRYGPLAQITTAGPTEGPFTGGTRVTINGFGFDDPVSVVVAGVAAQVISVTGTKIIVVTNGVLPTSCSNVTGPIVVTNQEDGASATGPNFIFDVFPPSILSVSSPVTEGTTATVTLANSGSGNLRFTIGDSDVIGVQTAPGVFTFTVPLGLTFKTPACITATNVAGVANVATPFDLKVTDSVTTCSDTLTKGITVIPVDTSCRVVNPTAGAITFTPTPLVFGAIPDCTTSAASTVTVTNTGGTALTLNQPASSNPQFTPSTLGSTTLAPGASTTFTVTFRPSGSGAQAGSVSLTAGTTIATLPVSGTGAAPTVSSISPNFGPATTPIVISGSGFVASPFPTVTIGGVLATVTGATTTTINLTAPAGTTGAKDVVITNANGCGTVTVVGGYTYP
jgi:hypothetical protein